MAEKQTGQRRPPRRATTAAPPPSPLQDSAPSGSAIDAARQEARSDARPAPRPDASAAMPLAPDRMMGLWVSWMGKNLGQAQNFTPPGLNPQALAQAWNPQALAQAWGTQANPWWQVNADQMTGSMLEAGVKQLNAVLAKDPMLKSIDTMWNANPFREVIPIDWSEVVRALRTVWLQQMKQPGQAMSAASQLGMDSWRSAIEAWNEAGRRWCGLDKGDGQKPAPNTGDKRFAAPEWHTNPVYRTLKDMYLLASDWLVKQGTESDGLEEAERQRLTFHLRQFVDAMSPTLLLLSNPAALRHAMETGGTSLVEGARNLMDDLKAGKLSMVDADAFAPGRNLAMTPGKVVFRNKLIELIQYSPTTPTVHEVPLLFVPPWINKFYVVDMQPKNSMMRYLVEQGFTVFMISWKNPDASMEEVSFEDYMRLGILDATDAIREITGSETVNATGYCIGGTLLTITLAWLAAKGDKRIGSASFMVSLQDFSRVGDTAVFINEPSMDFIEQQMMERGYLDSREMSNMFNLMRSNDLIWSNVVNNYLMGNKPPAFDLLYWNSDGTRMARNAHSWYLRNTYVENNLVKPGKVRVMGEGVDLNAIAVDAYAVGAEKDHIVPWDAAWRITQLFGGNVRYVLASSGHIAGVINPPGGKGQYWINEEPADSAEEWQKAAAKHDGSWWTDWSAWLAKRSGKKGKPPSMGSAKHKPLVDAPGTYVLEK